MAKKPAYSIVSDGQSLSTTPGDSRTYRLRRHFDTMSNSDGPKDKIHWYCIHDKVTAKAYGVAWYKKGPIDIGIWEDLNWSFAGRHRVICAVTPAHESVEHHYEFVEVVTPVESIVGPELRRMAVESSVDPEATASSMMRYIDNINAIEREKPTKDPTKKAEQNKSLENYKQYLDKLKEKLTETQNSRRYPVHAVHLDKETKTKTRMNVFIAFIKADVDWWGDYREEWTLVDWTNPVDRARTCEAFATGANAEEAIKNLFKDWDRMERYPPGDIVYEVSTKLAKIHQVGTIKGEIHCTGESSWDSVKSYMDWVALGTMAAGIALMVVPIPGSRVVSYMIWSSLFSGTAAAVINIAQSHAEGFGNAKDDLFDGLSIVSNLFGGAGMAAKAWSKGATFLARNNKQQVTKYLLIGEVGSDSVQGVAIAIDEVKKFNEAMDDPNLSAQERHEKLLGFFGSLAGTSLMTAISVKGNASDLKSLNKSPKALEGANALESQEAKTNKELLEDLDNPKKELDFTKPPKLEGKTEEGGLVTRMEEQPAMPVTSGKSPSGSGNETRVKEESQKVAQNEADEVQVPVEEVKHTEAEQVVAAIKRIEDRGLHFGQNFLFLEGKDGKQGIREKLQMLRDPNSTDIELPFIDKNNVLFEGHHIAVAMEINGNWTDDLIKIAKENTAEFAPGHYQGQGHHSMKKTAASDVIIKDINKTGVMTGTGKKIAQPKPNTNTQLTNPDSHTPAAWRNIDDRLRGLSDVTAQRLKSRMASLEEIVKTIEDDPVGAEKKLLALGKSWDDVTIKHSLREQKIPDQILASLEKNIAKLTLDYPDAALQDVREYVISSQWCDLPTPRGKYHVSPESLEVYIPPRAGVISSGKVSEFDPTDPTQALIAQVHARTIAEKLTHVAGFKAGVELGKGTYVPFYERTAQFKEWLQLPKTEERLLQDFTAEQIAKMPNEIHEVDILEMYHQHSKVTDFEIERYEVRQAYEIYLGNKPAVSPLKAKGDNLARIPDNVKIKPSKADEIIISKYGKYLDDTKKQGDLAHNSTVAMHAASFKKKLIEGSKGTVNSASAEFIFAFFDQKTKRIYINAEANGLDTSIMHESLHLYSSPKFENLVGTGLDEALTQHFTKAGTDAVGAAFDNNTYVHCTSLAYRLSRAVGDDVLEEAYFTGNLSRLKDAWQRNAWRWDAWKVPKGEHKGKDKVSWEDLLKNFEERHDRDMSDGS